MSEYLIRFLVGGAIVSAFSMLGDVMKPKASPVCSRRRLRWRSQRWALRSISMAQVTPLYRRDPPLMAGAVALAVYSVTVCRFSFERR